MRSKGKKGYYLLLSGVLAGIVNGLLGAGGGIIVVYALGIVLGDELCDVRDVFSNALCVMLPISAVSCVGYALMGELSTDGIGVFIIPAIIGGAAGGLLLGRVNTTFLKKLFAAIVIYSGIMLIVK
jgi:uncharacterized membrane protein YfcA